MPRAKKRAPIRVPPNTGRAFPTGPVHAIFKADGDETRGATRSPGGMPHDFENRTAKRAGALNVSVPGDFEPHMPGIAEWFRARSVADSRTANAPRKWPVSASSKPARKATHR